MHLFGVHDTGRDKKKPHEEEYEAEKYLAAGWFSQSFSRAPKRFSDMSYRAIIANAFLFTTKGGSVWCPWAHLQREKKLANRREGFNTSSATVEIARYAR